MKKFKTLRFIGLVGGLLLASLSPRLVFADCSGTNLPSKTQVAVSTTIASPTTILAASQTSACVQLMLNWSGSGTYPNGEYLLLSDTNSGFSNVSSTGTFRIPAGQRPSDFFNLGEYRGPLYGVVIGTTSAQNVSVVRKR